MKVRILPVLVIDKSNPVEPVPLGGGVSGLQVPHKLIATASVCPLTPSVAVLVTVLHPVR